MSAVLRSVADSVRALRPYRVGRSAAEVARERGIEDVVNLASNENPLGAGAAAAAALKGLDAAALARYPDAGGAALRSAIAEACAVADDCVVLGNGSNEILELAAHLTLSEGVAAVFSAHAFIVYGLACATRRARARVVPAREYAHDLEAMAEAAQAAEVRLVFVANPNNPTGTWHPPADVRRFLRRTPSHVLVVLDEAYCEYADGGGDSLALLREFENLLVVRTFSKIHGLAGLRAGYGIGNAAVIEMLNRIRQPFNMNVAAQCAAVAALGDEAHVARSVAMNREGKAFLTAELGRRGVSVLPAYGNFVTFLPAEAALVYERLLAGGVICRQLHEYAMGEWLRVTVGTAAQNARFLRSLDGEA